MGSFIPTSPTFITAVKDRTSLRYYKLLIDVNDDGTLDDVTSQIYNNNISGGGSLTTGSIWQVLLKNVGGTYSEGALAGAKCRIDVKCGTSDYYTVFTGFVDRKGADRTVTYLNDDTVTIKMFDFIGYSATQKNAGFYNFINYSLCDPSVTGNSIFHRLAYDMGLTASEINVTATLPYTKDYLGVGEDVNAYKELRTLNDCYVGELRMDYAGKLSFDSPFMTGWTQTASQWTLDYTNIISLDGQIIDALPNQVKTEFSHYQSNGVRVIHTNVTDWNTAFQKNEIIVQAGHFWPGGLIEGKKASLEFVDPKTGKKWDIGINIETPTIGLSTAATSYDIEATGLLTLHSFNGVSGIDKTLTEREPKAAQIILKNNTGSIVTINKLKIRGEPLTILSNEKVTGTATGITNTEIIDGSVDGRYMVSADQAHLVCKHRSDFGKGTRLRYAIVTDWLPNVQPGAIMSIDLSATVYPPSGVNSTFKVETFKHKNPNNALSYLTTELNLIDFNTFDATATLATSTLLYNGDASTEEQDTLESDISLRPTYTEIQTGYTVGGGTTTPTTPTISTSAGLFKGAFLQWDIQNDLTNFDHNDIQVSDDQSTWYKPQFNGTSFKDTVTATAGDYLEWPANVLTHFPIPLGGTSEAPTGLTLYYRVRRTTKEPVSSSWSSNEQVITLAISSGDVGANSIYANNIIAAQINTMLLRATAAIVIGYYGTGDNDTPVEGDRRAVIEDDQMRLEEWTAGAWSTVKGIMIGGALAGLFLSMVGCSGIYHPENPPTGVEYFPNVRYRVYDLEGDYTDQYGDDDWSVKSNTALSTTVSKFGSYSLFATTGNTAFLGNSTQGTVGNNQSAACWFYATDLTGTTDQKILMEFQIDDDKIRLGILDNDLVVTVTKNLSDVIPITTVVASISLNVWHHIGISYNTATDTLYITYDNTIYTYASIGGTWSTASFGVLFWTYNNSSNTTIYVDDIVNAADQFIDPDIWVQHYNHDIAWDTDFSAADTILRCNTGGRIRFDTQQTEESCGTLHMLSDADLPSSYVLAAGTAATFTDIDFSAYVPVGTKLILLRTLVFHNGDSSSNEAAFLIRKNGSSETNTAKLTRIIAGFTALTTGLTVGSSGDYIVQCDTSGIIEYKKDTGNGSLFVTIAGYWI